ncbi:MAG: hypothetical protein J3R72DRAFT_437737 [Linnemannia gamsii]|nr:MAG: hypothetical protein J3R72DRAFT_437737 [Linnemannia gamsii]
MPLFMIVLTSQRSFDHCLVYKPCSFVPAFFFLLLHPFNHSSTTLPFIKTLFFSTHFQRFPNSIVVQPPPLTHTHSPHLINSFTPTHPFHPTPTSKMTTEDAATSFNAVPHCTSACATASCQQHQQLSPPPSPPMSPASSVVSDSSMSSVDNSDSDSEDNDQESRPRIQVTFMRPGCIEEHIIKSRTLAAAKVAAAAAAAAGSTSMEH